MIRRVLLIATLFLTTTGIAKAGLVIHITQGVSQPTPIAVVPFGWKGQGKTPVNVAKVIRDDLARSGLFKPLAVKNMLAKPTKGKQIHFANWRAVNVNDLVIGSVSKNGSGGFTVRFQLYNVYSGKQLLGYQFPTNGRSLRFTAHVISDFIYKKLTGNEGAFATRIAYVQREMQKGHPVWSIKVADADGANAQTIVRSSSLLMSPAFSPNGKRIAYVAFEQHQSKIYVQNIATGARRIVSSRKGVNAAPAFSPGGNRLALVLSTNPGNTDIYVLNLKNHDLTQVTDSPAIDTEPAWMPNGKALVFTSDRGGSPQIYEKTLGSGAPPQRLTFNGSYNARPRVSPNGKWLAMVHRQNGALRIAMQNLKSGNFILLTNGPYDTSPSFAPNGSLVLYGAQKNGHDMLATVSTDGRVRQNLTTAGAEVTQPVWGPFPRRPHLGGG